MSVWFISETGWDGIPFVLLDRREGGVEGKCGPNKKSLEGISFKAF